jgi:hypothetical protein
LTLQLASGGKSTVRTVATPFVAKVSGF